MTKAEVIEKIIGLTQLQHDWSGMGHAKPNLKAINDMLIWFWNNWELNGKLVDRIVPGSDGEVCVSWTENRLYREFTFDGSNHDGEYYEYDMI